MIKFLDVMSIVLLVFVAILILVGIFWTRDSLSAAREDPGVIDFHKQHLLWHEEQMSILSPGQKGGIYD